MRIPRKYQFFALASLMPLSVFAQSQSTRLDSIKLSPTSLSVIQPGLSVTDATIRRWIAATELSEEQMKAFGFEIGTYGEEKIRSFIESSEDRIARRFIEHYDFFSGGSSMPREVSQLRSERFSKGLGGAQGWKELSLEPFVDDAVDLGRFDTKWRGELTQALKIASEDAENPEVLRARATASRLLDEARRAAVKRARGYKLLLDVLKKEIEGRDFVQSIALVVEVGSGERQPTIAPLTIANLQCSGGPQGELVFMQRQKDCNDRGICRVDSVASVLDKPNYRAVFKALEGKAGRQYLDSCRIKTTMLIDGAEIERSISGRFISHSQQNQP